MSEAAAFRDLERKLEELDAAPRRFRSPDAGGRRTVPTGVTPLDELLPRGGLPRGEGTEWLGPRSCGKTALLRMALLRLRSAGEPVALVDTARTLYAPDWETSGAEEGFFWVVRPPREDEAPWCADLLLRSGAFGAVALVSGEERPALERKVAVRLQRLAQEAGAVFVTTARLPVASLRLRFRPGRIEPVGGAPFGPFLPPVRPVWVRVRGGGSVEVPVLCPRLPERASPRPARDRKGRR